MNDVVQETDHFGCICAVFERRQRLRIPNGNGGDWAKLRPADDLFRFEVGRVEHLFEANTNVPIGFGTDPHHFLNLRRRTRWRFLDPRVGAGTEAIDR